jgi:sortase A
MDVGTARPGEEGNIGIAGHRDGLFRGLKDVVVGNSIALKTLKETDKYIVDQSQIVKPNQVDVLRPRHVPSLTLVTCYPFYFWAAHRGATSSRLLSHGRSTARLEV